MRPAAIRFWMSNWISFSRCRMGRRSRRMGFTAVATSGRAAPIVRSPARGNGAPWRIVRLSMANAARSRCARRNCPANCASIRKTSVSSLMTMQRQSHRRRQDYHRLPAKSRFERAGKRQRGRKFRHVPPAPAGGWLAHPLVRFAQRTMACGLRAQGNQRRLHPRFQIAFSRRRRAATDSLVKATLTLRPNASQ